MSVRRKFLDFLLPSPSEVSFVGFGMNNSIHQVYLYMNGTILACIFARHSLICSEINLLKFLHFSFVAVKVFFVLCAWEKQF